MTKVVVFSAKWCPPCQSLKKALRARSVPFSVVDIDTPAGDRLSDELGVASIPAVFIETEGRYVRVREPSPASIARALERHGQ